MDLLKLLITESKYFASIENYNFWIEDYSVEAEGGESVDFMCQVCFENRADKEDYGCFNVQFTGNFSYDADGATTGTPELETMKVTPSDDPNEKGITHLLSKGIRPENFRPVLERLATNLVHTFADKNPYKFKDRSDQLAYDSHIDSKIDDMKQRDR